MDKRWSSVANLLEQRWLDHAIDHRRGKSVASVFGGHKDEGVLKLKALLERFGLTRYETGYGGLTHVIGMGMGPSRATAIPRKLNGNT